MKKIFKTQTTLFYAILAIIAFGCKNKDVETSFSQSPEVKKESKSITGTYSYGTDIDKGPIGTVYIYSLTDSTALFYVGVNKGAPSYNSGSKYGEITIKDNVAIYDKKNSDPEEKDCVFKFEFKSGELKLVTEKNECGFGNGVTLDGTYKLVDSSKPKYFITEGIGDTIYFKNLEVKK